MSKLMNYSRTCATVFLIRPLGLCSKTESLNPKDPNAAKIIKKYGFIEAYLYDENRTSTSSRVVYCLFKPPNFQEFEEFVKMEIEDKVDIVDEYDYPNGHVILVYKFPEIYNNDYDLILQGKYSKCSDAFKSLFPITKSKTELTIYALVFYHESKLKSAVEDDLNVKFDKDMEFWYIPDVTKETLTYNKIKKL
jgi:hypothetical protein